jgi:DNA-binding NtrC family response regulator
MTGASPAFRRVLEMAGAVAGSDAPVLLLGETGTGKEVLARHIHGRSRRAHRPFVGINCGALPTSLLESELFGHERGAFTGAVSARPGRFEEADGGTIFLDEVGECLPELQVKLLRVLEEKEFSRLGSNRRIGSDFRLLAATNRDLEQAVRGGAFREDLYFRLNVFEIRLPPLRERAEDIPALAMHLIRRNAAREGRSVDGIDARALELLGAYRWPGNIRELDNVLHRAVILAGEGSIKPGHLPGHLGRSYGEGGGETPLPGFSFAEGRTLTEWERMIIRTTLVRCRGNKSRTARLLGISRKVLYAKMGRHGLEN